MHGKICAPIVCLLCFDSALISIVVLTCQLLKTISEMITEEIFFASTSNCRKEADSNGKCCFKVKFYFLLTKHVRDCVPLQDHSLLLRG